jgi:hypothetical protein
VRQIFLKASYNLGWAISDYRISFGGKGNTAGVGGAAAEVPVPLAGTFSNLTAYSPPGAHPNYTIILLVNGVETALKCAVASTEQLATDRANSVNVVAGDLVCFRVTVNPPGSGFGYPLNLSVEFEGAAHWFGAIPGGAFTGPGTTEAGGCLGNGFLSSNVGGAQLSTSYSICSTPGTLTGIRIRENTVGIGGGWLAWIRKNGINQDGTGGTVNTQVALADGGGQASNTFSLPIAVGDHLDFAYTRTTTGIGTSTHIALTCTFIPTDQKTFMNTGGSNNANSNGIEYRWMASEQLAIAHEIVKCPVGPRGIIVTGLRVEVDTQSVAPVIFTVTKNGVDTPVTCTVPLGGTFALIENQRVTYSDGDYIALKSNAASFSGNGMYWGLSAEVYRDRSGLYEVKPGTRDKYYGDVEKKIPDPTVKTALIGE